jgi:hypothetical protein
MKHAKASPAFPYNRAALRAKFTVPVHLGREYAVYETPGAKKIVIWSNL